MSEAPVGTQELIDSFDAQDWANEFCRIFPGHDEGSMLGWFANALMSGYREAQRQFMGFENWELRLLEQLLRGALQDAYFTGQAFENRGLEEIHGVLKRVQRLVDERAPT